MVPALPAAPAPRTGHVGWPLGFLESMVKLKTMQAF
jgi:hypothetical protein